MTFNWVGKSEDGKTVTLRQLDGIIQEPYYYSVNWLAENAEAVRIGIAIDVETTGLNRLENKVIEIGLVRFKFNRHTGEVLEIEKSYSALQDPEEPLSDQIKALTGLDDEALRGQSIDWTEVNRLISDAHIVIAHNASFDRPFIDRYATESEGKIWGCSLKQVDWLSKGYGIQKLEVLSIYHGFFTESHRALNDVKALLHLMSLEDRITKFPYLKELLSNARRPRVRVIATHSPFEAKSLLKENGYKWDNQNRLWLKTLEKEGLDTEVSWLEEAVYCGKFLGTTQEIPLVDSFKLTKLDL